MSDHSGHSFFNIQKTGVTEIQSLRFCLQRYSFLCGILGDQAPEEFYILKVQFSHQCCHLFDHLFFFHVAPPYQAVKPATGRASVSSPCVFIINEHSFYCVSNYVADRNYLDAFSLRMRSATCIRSARYKSGN